MGDRRKNTLGGLAALAVVFAGLACGETEPENQAPVAEGEIPALSVVAGETWSGSIVQFFSDPDGDTLTYRAESDDTDVLTVEMQGGQLRATGVVEGTAQVSIVATDPGDLSAEQTADFTILRPNQPPVLIAPIPDLTVPVDGEVVIPVSFVFSDPDGDDLSYTAESDNTGVATVDVNVSDATVTVSGVAVGTANITVTATDPGNLSVSDTFEVTVEEEDN